MKELLFIVLAALGIYVGYALLVPLILVFILYLLISKLIGRIRRK